MNPLNNSVHAPIFAVIDLPLTDPLLGVPDLRELRVESRERRISDGRERRVSDGREPEMSDGLEQLYRVLEQANLTALGDPKPCSRQELRRCFTQRARDPLLNDRLHRVRALRSTLKVSAIAGLVKRKCVKISVVTLACGLSPLQGQRVRAGDHLCPPGRPRSVLPDFQGVEAVAQRTLLRHLSA